MPLSRNRNHGGIQLTSFCSFDIFPRVCRQCNRILRPKDGDDSRCRVHLTKCCEEEAAPSQEEAMLDSIVAFAM